jgi:hypothetical protein
MVGALHNILVENSVVLVHGNKQFVVFKVNGKFAHVNQLIFFGSFTGYIQIMVSLNEHAFNISKGLPILNICECGVFFLEPCTIEIPEFDKNVTDVSFRFGVQLCLSKHFYF